MSLVVALLYALKKKYQKKNYVGGSGCRAPVRCRLRLAVNQSAAGKKKKPEHLDPKALYALVYASHQTRALQVKKKTRKPKP